MSLRFYDQEKRLKVTTAGQLSSAFKEANRRMDCKGRYRFQREITCLFQEREELKEIALLID